MKVVGVIQARAGSLRFPRKIFANIHYDHSVLSLVITRCKQSCSVLEWWVATTDQFEDINRTAALAKKFGANVFHGSASDVRSRFLEVAELSGADCLVRITADCPLIDPTIIDEVVAKFTRDASLDYCSNTISATFPDGLDVEVFTVEALRRSSILYQDLQAVEHVTLPLRTSRIFKTENVFNHFGDESSVRITVDYKDDIPLIVAIIERYGVYALYREFKEFLSYNSHSSRIRDEGADMTSDRKRWKHSEEVIAGGNCFWSKHPDTFVDSRPIYYKSAHGCTIETLDGERYLDFGLMGIGCNVLGYSNPVVNSRVMQRIENGSFSTLNCFEEVELAERLIELHPWSDLVRFARTGAEANAISIRLARVASGRNRIAISGYHGWHDWYLAANGDVDSLKSHIIPGIPSGGIPSALNNNTCVFEGGDYQSFDEALAYEDLAAVIMEVSRLGPIDHDFLTYVRDQTRQKGIVLIFDECSSGFRTTFGGFHLSTRVTPDICTVGKALGNGYAITAVVGVKEVMEGVNKTFISSTFFSEGIGFAAGIATLDEMARSVSHKVITEFDFDVRQWMAEFATRLPLDTHVRGMPGLPSLYSDTPQWPKLRAWLMESFQARGILFHDTIYLSLAHIDHFQRFKEIADVIGSLVENKTMDDLEVKSHRLPRSRFKS